MVQSLDHRTSALPARDVRGGFEAKTVLLTGLRKPFFIRAC